MAVKFNALTATLDEYGPVLTGSGTVSAAADGTAALPGISFANDLNTGIYKPGVDQVAISTGGTGRLFVDASGNVGVNTSSPLTNGYPAFTVSNSTQANLYFEDTGYELTGNGVGFFSWDNGALAFSAGSRSGTGTTGSSEYLRIDNSGDVGIGQSSPTSRLHITGNNAALTLSEGTALGRIQTDSGGSLVFSADVNNAAGTNGHLFYVDGTERMRIDSSGRLLVGTSTNTGGSLLQVNDNRIRVATAKTPASATDTGAQGEICWDSSYLYVCTATNTWKRAALATW